MLLCLLVAYSLNSIPMAAYNDLIGIDSLTFLVHVLAMVVSSLPNPSKNSLFRIWGLTTY